MKNRALILCLLCLIAASLRAQTDSTRKDSLQYDLGEVTITGFQSNSPKQTSLNIEPFSLSLINEKTPFNLSDALAKIPGISQMSTGNSISKPVIRGLYGNRILVLLSGLRFDNQQWQDEHGLGLSQIGIDRVEVIKGPASLLYGSDALGGVINIIEEKPQALGKKIDVGTQLFSNTLGTLTDAGFSNKKEKSWWRIRLGAENHADYSGGDGKRVLNSRNNGYYLKAGLGFERARWKQENSYNFSYNNYGFVMDELASFFSPDARWSRAMAGPHHIVMLNLANSQNTFILSKSTLKLNAGFQSNLRMEDEGGGSISLNMHLMSVLQNLKWEKQLSEHITFITNQQFTFTNNTNYGGRIIIPDANMIEGNLSGYFKFFFKKLIVETGVGGNYKFIQTFFTRTLNGPGEAVQPFTKNAQTGNGMLGFVYNATEHFFIKANASSGFRAPNLAELSSNGIHEGVFRYERGDPNLKLEQNVNSDLTLELDAKRIFLSVSAYYNRFFNYVYLAPTDEQWIGYQVFKYMQQNASIYGGEFYSSIGLDAHKVLQWKNGFTITQGVRDDGLNLPFIPARKATSSIRYEKKFGGRISKLFVEPEFMYVLPQYWPAMFEKSTADYFLINLYSGVTIPKAKGDWKLGLVCTNMTNNAYYDHLSRLKYYGLLNQGINFVISVRKEFK